MGRARTVLSRVLRVAHLGRAPLSPPKSAASGLGGRLRGVDGAAEDGEVPADREAVLAI